MPTNGTTQRKAKRYDKFERHKRALGCVFLQSIVAEQEPNIDLGSGSFK